MRSFQEIHDDFQIISHKVIDFVLLNDFTCEFANLFYIFATLLKYK